MKEVWNNWLILFKPISFCSYALFFTPVMYPIQYVGVNIIFLMCV